MMLKNSITYLKRARWFVLLLAVAVLSSCNWIFDGIRGSGVIVEEDRRLNPFHSISMGISADLFFSVGFPQDFRIIGDDNILEVIKTTVKSNGTLDIYSRRNLRPTSRIKIFISMFDAEAFTLSGSGTMLGQNSFSVDDLTLFVSGSGSMEMDVSANQITSTISGSGDIRLSGSTITHDIKISGSGTLSALDLDSRNCDVLISGSGEGYIFVQDFLTVNISGSGNVNYMGSPVISSNISGSGQVIKLD